MEFRSIHLQCSQNRFFCTLCTIWPQDQAPAVVQSCQKSQELVGITFPWLLAPALIWPKLTHSFSTFGMKILIEFPPQEVELVFTKTALCLALMPANWD